MSDRTQYQENIIKRYYKYRDSIMWQKLSDLVTDLYLAEGKKREQVWKRIVKALENLEVPQDYIDHLCSADNPSLLLKFIERKGGE